MAEFIAPWLIGSGTSMCVLTRMTPVSTGVLNESAYVYNMRQAVASTYGALDAVELEYSTNMENISPMDRPFVNNVLIEKSFAITLTEVMQNDGGNLLATAILDSSVGGSYFKIQIKRGSKGFRFYGICRSYRESIVKGKCVATATFDIIDTTLAGNVRYDANPSADN